MSRRRRLSFIAAAAIAPAMMSSFAFAGGKTAAGDGWLSGEWSLTLGVSTFAGPRFEGSGSYIFDAAPLVSIGRAGQATRFSSRNDNVSFALFDYGNLRAGLTGKLLLPRNADHGLTGLHDVPFGGEVGVFAEVYPLDWLRVRGELRQGIRAHHGVVADIDADAFIDITPRTRISGGPRLSLASAKFFNAYYGVSPAEAAASGLSAYSPGGGLHSAGFGGAVTWKTTDRLTTSVFAEYSRLLGPAADSSIVKERGSPDQFLAGVSATYRFDFRLR